MKYLAFVVALLAGSFFAAPANAQFVHYPQPQVYPRPYPQIRVYTVYPVYPVYPVYRVYPQYNPYFNPYTPYYNPYPYQPYVPYQPYRHQYQFQFQIYRW